MTVLKTVKRTRKGMYFAIIGIVLTILLVNLVVICYVNTLKIENAFSTFTANSSYEIMFSTTKQNTKRKLFDYQNYHFYSYGIKDININYNSLEINLREALRKEYLTIKDFLENFQLIYETEDKSIIRYESKNLKMVLFKLNENYVDVVFSLKG